MLLEIVIFVIALALHLFTIATLVLIGIYWNIIFTWITNLKRKIMKQEPYPKGKIINYRKLDNNNNANRGLPIHILYYIIAGGIIVILLISIVSIARFLF